MFVYEGIRQSHLFVRSGDMCTTDEMMLSPMPATTVMITAGAVCLIVRDRAVEIDEEKKNVKRPDMKKNRSLTS